MPSAYTSVVSLIDGEENVTKSDLLSVEKEGETCFFTMGVIQLLKNRA